MKAKLSNELGIEYELMVVTIGIENVSIGITRKIAENQ